MTNPFSSTANLDPEAGFTPPSGNPSVAQAANDLRVAAGEKAREIVHDVEAKAASLKERAVESAQHLREVATEKAGVFKASAAEKAEALKHAAGEKAQHLRECATEQWQDTRVKAKELHITAEDYIRQNPSKCVLGAIGIGFLIGLIVRR
jgi:ElaB/YqjD/DUF883 family membrane-anchored ribosome-binding protein